MLQTVPRYAVERLDSCVLRGQSGTVEGRVADCDRRVSHPLTYMESGHASRASSLASRTRRGLCAGDGARVLRRRDGGLRAVFKMATGALTHPPCGESECRCGRRCACRRLSGLLGRRRRRCLRTIPAARRRWGSGRRRRRRRRGGRGFGFRSGFLLPRVDAARCAPQLLQERRKRDVFRNVHQAGHRHVAGGLPGQSLYVQLRAREALRMHGRAGRVRRMLPRHAVATRREQRLLASRFPSSRHVRGRAIRGGAPRPRERRTPIRNTRGGSFSRPRRGSKSVPGVMATPVSRSKRRQRSSLSSVEVRDVGVEIERAVGRSHVGNAGVLERLDQDAAVLAVARHVLVHFAVALERGWRCGLRERRAPDERCWVEALRAADEVLGHDHPAETPARRGEVLEKLLMTSASGANASAVVAGSGP